MAPNRDQELNALLAGYAMGQLPVPLSVMIEGHLELSPHNRGFVADLEAMAGRVLEDGASAPLRDRDAKLAAIFALDALPPAPPAPRRAPGRLPEAIRRFVGHDVETLPWKSKLPGFKEYKLGEFDGLKPSIFLIRAGQKIPHHTHDGGEITLVLEGGFSDASGSYERGDLSINDSSVDHQPIAHDDADCLCFAVTDAPLRLTGMFGRLFNPFIRG